MAKVSLMGLDMGNMGGGMSSSGSAVTGVQVTGSAQRGVNVRQLIDDAVLQASSGRSVPQSVTGVTLVPTTACTVSGSSGMTDTRASATAAWAATDTLTITYTACVMSAITNDSLNGTIVLSNMAWGTGAAGARPLTAATMTFNLSMSIPATATSSASTFTMTNVADSFADNTTTKTNSLTGTSMKITSGANFFELSNFSYSSTLTVASNSISETSNYTIGSDLIGGTITVKTPTAFTISSLGGKPTAGVMEISSNLTPPDPAAVRVTVTASATAPIKVDFFANGFITNGVANTPTQTNTYAWAAL